MTCGTKDGAGLLLLEADDVARGAVGTRGALSRRWADGLSAMRVRWSLPSESRWRVSGLE